MATDFYGLVTKEKLKYKQQGFSGTDLDKDVNDTGIVYPLKHADGLQASFSSIVDHEDGDTILAHSEYRIARNIPDNIEYIKGTCFSVVYRDTILEKSTEAEELIGIAPYANVLAQSYIVAEPGTREFNKEFFTKFDEILATLDFEPVFIIDDKNLSKKEVIVPTKPNSLWDNINPIWGNIEKVSTTKKVSRKEIEKDIYKLRTDINKLCKENGFNIASVDEEYQLMIEANLLDYTYDELLELRLELEDLYWDLMCEGA